MGACGGGNPARVYIMQVATPAKVCWWVSRCDALRKRRRRAEPVGEANLAGGSGAVARCGVEHYCHSFVNKFTKGHEKRGQ